MNDKLVDSTLLKKLNTLKLNTNLILNKGYDGTRKSKSKGSSVEFSDFREYVPGDDFRKIDWNAYGRFEKLFIKLFMEERQSLVNIFLDTSHSMDFGTPKKSFISKQLALSLGYLSLANLDRVKIYSNGDGTLDSSENLSGKNTLSKLANYLENVELKNDEDIFSLIRTRPYKKGISIIISDVFSDEFEEAIKYLAYMKQNIIIIHILNKEELEPQYVGDLRFIDSETRDAKDVSLTSSVLKSYEATLKHFLGNTKEICRRYSCMYTLLSNQISTEEMIFDKLIREGILR